LGDRLVVHRQQGPYRTLVLDLPELREFAPKLSLQLYFDPQRGRLWICSAGKLLGEFHDATVAAAGNDRYLRIRNQGESLICSRLRVTQWDGNRVESETVHAIHVHHEGQVTHGESLLLAANSRQLTMEVAGEPWQIDLADVISVVFPADDLANNLAELAVESHAVDVTGATRQGHPGRSVVGLADRTLNEGQMRARYQNGGVVIGRFLSFVTGGVKIETDWAGTFVVPFADALQMGFHLTPGDPGVFTGALSYFDGRLHGKMVAGDENGALMWQPVFSDTVIALPLASGERLTFDIGSATAPPHGCDRIYLTTGDVLPASILHCDAEHLVFELAGANPLRLPREHVKAIELGASQPVVRAGFQGIPAWRPFPSSAEMTLDRDEMVLVKPHALLSEVGLPTMARVEFDCKWRGDGEASGGLIVGFGEYAVEENRPRRYAEVQIMRQGKRLHANMVSQGVDWAWNRRQEGAPRLASLEMGESRTAHLELLCDLERREYLVFANGVRLLAWRDRHGVRPDVGSLVFGRMNTSRSNDDSAAEALVLSNLRVLPWTGNPSQDKLNRLLTRPAGTDPAELSHLMRASSGDSLRGNLLAVTPEHVMFRTRSDTLTVPRSIVGEIVSLRPTTIPIESPAADGTLSPQEWGVKTGGLGGHASSLEAGSEDADGGVYLSVESADVTLGLVQGGWLRVRPVRSTASSLIAETPQFGEFAVPWQSVWSIEAPGGQTVVRRPPHDFARWVLGDPVPPPAAPDR
ncbi:MAG: hypothetical protein KDA60_13025, partial [Planctomycetales bacterium]|nr:hypothetical protein [Planctomycetales bacterium]